MPELRASMEPVAAVVIPTLNEAAAIGTVIRELPRDLVRQVIVADGGSTDGTPEIARAAGAVVVAAGRGYGRACAAGVAAADPDCAVIVFLDGDGADRGDLMHQIAGPIIAGTHDLVLASRTRGVRERGAMNWHQVAAGHMAGFAIGALYGVRYSDMCAYRAIRRDALGALAMREMTYGWNIEMQMKAARARLRVQEVPLPYRRRLGGVSKVAGSFRGTARASFRIGAAFLRVALART